MKPLADRSPMEREFPTICEWTRHGAVSTDHLREELLRALAFIESPWPRPAPRESSR